VFSGWCQSYFFDVFCEDCARLRHVRIDDGSDVPHVELNEAADIAEFDAQRIGPGFEHLCGYLADLALAVNESRTNRRRKIPLRHYVSEIIHLAFELLPAPLHAVQFPTQVVQGFQQLTRSWSEIAKETGWTKGTVQRAIYGQKSRPGLPKIV